MTRLRFFIVLALVAAAGVFAAGRRSVDYPELTAAAGPGDYERSLEHGGRNRRYEVHLPPQYGASKPLPLVLNFHGGGGDAHAARISSKMDAKADAAGFIVVYPEGTGRFARRFLTWNAALCCGYAKANSIDDVGFARAVLADAAKLLKVDRRRVYATGLSNGAMLCYRLACEMAEELAAIAPVAGALVMQGCEPARSVPLLHIHGTDDQNAPLEGGIGRRSLSRTYHHRVRAAIKQWQTHNDCDPTTATTTKGHVTTERWTSSEGSAEIVLITVEGGGHVWPGGYNPLPEWMVGADAGGLDANHAIWEFFSRHALPERD